MCLVALVAALGFAIAVPRRGAARVRSMPAADGRDLERAAA